MLTLTPINNIEYYKNIDQDDYYISDEGQGYWHGKLSKRLKLGQVMDSLNFESVMKGLHPRTGKPLFSKNQNVKKAGWDLTFSAPKSVSLTWAKSTFQERKKIQEAQKKAVQTTLDYVEKYIAGVKRGKNGIHKESGAGILAAIVDHYSSRELEPQLHSHAVIPNLCEAKDGKLMALDSRKIYLNQKTIGAIYRGQLATQLSKLGYSLERDGESFRIASIPKDIETLFSTRTQQITKALSSSGVTSSASSHGDVVKVSTRKAKREINERVLLPMWSDKINEAINKASFTNRLPVCDKDSVSDPAEKLTAKQSSFTTQQLEYEVALQNMLSGKSTAAIKKSINSYFHSSELIKLANGVYSDRYTTRKVLQSEELLIEHVTAIDKRSSSWITESQLNQACGIFESEVGFKLSEEQQMALESACFQSDFSIIQGSAGAGKSSVMRVIQILARLNQKKVLGATTVKMAANNLMNESGIRSYTISKVLTELTNNPEWLSTTDILVIDEAGQVPSTQLLDVVSAARRSKTKLILTGEDKQLDAITHGGALAYLSEKFGCYRIEKIQRQADVKERSTVEHLRDGNTADAFEYLRKNQRLHIECNAQAAISSLIEKVIQFQRLNSTKEFIVLASKWRQVNEISQAIRGHMKSEGSLSGPEYIRSCSVAGKVFEFGFCQGDSVRFTRNDYKLGVVNGTTGTIRSISTTANNLVKFRVELDNGREITFDESQYSDESGNLQLAYAYASTVYGSQGLTVAGDSFILWDSSMHRAMTYVAGSRQKNESHWFVNKAQIKEFIEKGSDSYIDAIVRLSGISKSKELATQAFERHKIAQSL